MTDKQIIIDDLMKQLNEKTVAIMLLKETLDRKEQECEELKEEKQGLIKDWEENKNLAYEIACKNEKLKQAIAEIKEIAESYNHYSAHAPVSGYSDILQKISEVEE